MHLKGGRDSSVQEWGRQGKGDMLVRGRVCKPLTECGKCTHKEDANQSQPNVGGKGHQNAPSNGHGTPHQNPSPVLDLVCEHGIHRCSTDMGDTTGDSFFSANTTTHILAQDTHMHIRTVSSNEWRRNIHEVHICLHAHRSTCTHSKVQQKQHMHTQKAPRRDCVRHAKEMGHMHSLSTRTRSGQGVLSDLSACEKSPQQHQQQEGEWERGNKKKTIKHDYAASTQTHTHTHDYEASTQTHTHILLHKCMQREKCAAAVEIGMDIQDGRGEKSRSEHALECNSDMVCQRSIRVSTPHRDCVHTLHACMHIMSCGGTGHPQ